VRYAKALGAFTIFRAGRAAGGKALRAKEDRVRQWMALGSADEGLAICPETAACLAVLEGAVQSGEVEPGERVVVFNTGAAQKHVEAMDTDLPRLDVEDVDWQAVERALA